MKKQKIGIIGAMDIEVNMLKQMCTSVNTVQSGGRTYVEGLLDGIPVVIVQCGVGKVNAALCAQRLILQFEVTHVINTGIAGAMASGLRVQDIVVSTNAVYHDFDVSGFGYPKCKVPGRETIDFVADEKMIEAAVSSFENLEEAKGHAIIKGRIASGDQFIASKSQKDTIRTDCNPACVEMEGSAIAHACEINEVPFVIIRCMSDMADDNGHDTYEFNETEAAVLSAKLVYAMIKKI